MSSRSTPPKYFLTTPKRRFLSDPALGPIEELSEDDIFVELRQDTLEKLRHECLLLPVGCGIASSGRLMTVTPYAPFGVLESLLSRGRLPFQLLKHIGVQVSQGMLYLHDQPPRVLHLDLKPANIFLFTGYQVRLGDLGHACIQEDSSWGDDPDVHPARPHRRRDATLYAAPEVFDPQGELCTKADVFSFGVVLYAMLVAGSGLTLRGCYEQHAQVLLGAEGAAAVAQMSDAQLREAHPALRPTAVRPYGVPSELWALIQQCLDHDPTFRPEFHEVLPRLLTMEPPYPSHVPINPQLPPDVLIPPPSTLPSSPSPSLSEPLTHRPPSPPATSSRPPPSQEPAPSHALPSAQLLQHTPQPTPPNPTPQPNSQPAPLHPKNPPVSTNPSNPTPIRLPPSHTAPPSCADHCQAPARTDPRIVAALTKLREVLPNSAEQHFTPAEALQRLQVTGHRFMLGRWMRHAVAHLPWRPHTSRSYLELAHLTLKAALPAAHIIDQLPIRYSATDWLIGTWGARFFIAVCRAQQQQQQACAGTAQPPPGAFVEKLDMETRLTAAVLQQEVDAADADRLLRCLGRQQHVMLRDVLAALHAEVAAPEQEGLLEGAVSQEGLQLADEFRATREMDVASRQALWAEQWSRLLPGLSYLEQVKASMGAGFPEALFLPPVAEGVNLQKVMDVMEGLRQLWDAIHEQYHAGVVGERFFQQARCRWALRGRMYREVVEPLDIALWYLSNTHAELARRHRCGEGLGEGCHYADGIDTEEMELHHDNGRRPGRYALLQRMEVGAFPGQPLERTLGAARRFKQMLGGRRWEEAAGVQQHWQDCGVGI